MRSKRLYDRLCEFSAIGSGSIPGVPLVEIIADRRVLIENHKGVYRYTREQICIHSASGMIRIDGKQLYIEKMSHDQLAIVGKINGVVLCRGGKNAD